MDWNTIGNEKCRIINVGLERDPSIRHAHIVELEHDPLYMGPFLVTRVKGQLWTLPHSFS